IVLVGLSIVTLRYFVHIAPLWVVLTISGAAVVVLASWLGRALRRAPDGEIGGLTAHGVFSGERRQRGVAIGPGITPFTPPSTPLAEEKGYAGGGRFGGGGASERF